MRFARRVLTARAANHADCKKLRAHGRKGDTTATTTSRDAYSRRSNGQTFRQLRNRDVHAHRARPRAPITTRGNLCKYCDHGASIKPKNRVRGPPRRAESLEEEQNRAPGGCLFLPFCIAIAIARASAAKEGQGSTKAPCGGQNNPAGPKARQPCGAGGSQTPGRRISKLDEYL